MSRLELLDPVRVLNTCPDECWRGYPGVIVDGSNIWGMVRVEIVKGGKMHRPLILASHLQKIELHEDAICDQCTKATALYCEQCKCYTCIHYSLEPTPDEHRCNWCESLLEESPESEASA